MDFITIIIGLIVLGLSVAFVLYFTNTESRMKSELQNFLKKIAKENNFEFSQFDVSHHFGIAIDERKKQIIWVQKKDYDLQYQNFSFADFNKSTLLINGSKENTNTSDIMNDESCSVIYLVLHHNKLNQSDTVLEFYDVHQNTVMKDEKELAAKWVQIINGFITKL